MKLLVVGAFVWGFAEAVLFFIVPDVLLTRFALSKPRRQVWCCCFWALVGALLGGAGMYAWGGSEPQAALAILQKVPAVNARMCANVAQQLQEYGLLALFIGPLRGVPYKIYAVQSGVLQMDIFSFLLISIPARLLRFLLIVELTRFLVAHLRITKQWATWLWGLGWIFFYAMYFLNFMG